MKNLRRIASLASALLLPIAAQAATDPFLGTWRLDKAKSIIANDPGVKSKEFVFAPVADGVAVTATVEMNGGEKQTEHLRYAYGKFTPQTGAGFDSFSVVRTNARTAIWTVRLKGKTLSRLQVVLSADGREMTFRYLYAASDPTGKAANDRYVYDRQ